MKLEKLVLLALLAVLTPTAASLDINSTTSLRYFPDNNLEFEVTTGGQVNAQDNLTLGGNSVEDLNKLYGDTSGTNFFGSCSDSGQYVHTINADGSVTCATDDKESTVEDLNATLAAGDIANQSIRMDNENITGIDSVKFAGNVTIGNGSTSIGGAGSLAIGRGASTGAYESVAIGRMADTGTTQKSVAVGYKATTYSGNGQTKSVAIGHSASGTAQESVAIGYNAQTSGSDKAEVVIGSNANSAKEATVIGKAAGNNNIAKHSVIVGMDSDVTGKGGVMVGEAGSAAKDATALGEGADAKSEASISVGDHAGSPQTSGFGAVAVGQDTVSPGTDAIAVGRLANASASGAVAIGNQSRAVNSYEATFGNLGGEKLDVNVTGNVTVHGVGNVTLKNANLDLGGNGLKNVGSTECSAQEYLGGDGSCYSDSTGGSATTNVETLNETLTAGDDANQSIDMVGYTNISFGNQGDLKWSGDADISTNSLGNKLTLSDVQTLDTDGGFSQIQVKGSGGRLVIEDNSHNDNDMADFNNGGPIQFQNPVTNKVMIEMNHTKGSMVEIPNGGLNVTGGNVTLEQPASGDPVMGYNFREGANFGGSLEYTSKFNGDTGDNRLRLYTLQSGTENEGITLDRNGDNVNVHRTLDVKSNNITDVGNISINSYGVEITKDGTSLMHFVDSTEVAVMTDDLLVGGSTADTATTVQLDSPADNAVAVGTKTPSADSGGTAVGNSAGTGTDGVAVGRDADAGGGGQTAESAVAVGDNAVVNKNARNSIAIGAGADILANADEAILMGGGAEIDSDSDQSIAIGDDANVDLSATDAIAIGNDVNASANGAVAIGNHSRAPNPFEATFGNLGTEKLDVNITGNTTVHGVGGLDMKEGNVSQVDWLTSGSDNSVKVDGHLNVTGQIDETFGDVAEKYPSTQELDKGEMVRLSRLEDGKIVRTDESMGEVVGVVATKPGIILDSDTEGYPVTLVGKAPVKVNMENGEIDRGDRIVPSSEEGVGMKCEILEPGETRKSLPEVNYHNQECERASIGKALEDADGKEEIMVMLNGK